MLAGGALATSSCESLFMSFENKAVAYASDADDIQGKRGWFVALGVGLIVLGLAAILAPFYGTMAGTRVFAWLLIFSAFVAAVHAVAAHTWSGAIFQALIAAAYLLVGAWLLGNWVEGILVLTMALIATLYVQGIISVLEALQLRPMQGWKRLLFSGICSIILGAMLWMRFPSSALWAIGLLFGLSLLINGAAFLSLGLGVSGSYAVREK